MPVFKIFFTVIKISMVLIFCLLICTICWGMSYHKIDRFIWTSWIKKTSWISREYFFKMMPHFIQLNQIWGWFSLITANENDQAISSTGWKTVWNKTSLFSLCEHGISNSVLFDAEIDFRLNKPIQDWVVIQVKLKKGCSKYGSLLFQSF